MWALGATLYAAVEGHSPYEQRSNPVAVLHDIAQYQPPHPKRADFLEPALQRLMDRDPGSRWSMDDAAHVLRRIADEHKPEAPWSTRCPTPLLCRTSPPEEPASATRGAPPETHRRRQPVATPPAPRPTPRPATAAGDGAARRIVLAAAALLLLLGGVAWYVSQLGDGEQADDTGGEQASSSSDSTKETDDSRRLYADSGSDTAPTSAAEEKEEFVRSYFEKAPGGTDEAWAMLGPSLKEQGRASYNGFWRGIESVEVESVNATRTATPWT